MAKYNLETQYSVVGLLEHFNYSIAVMENYLPGKKKSYLLKVMLNCSILFGGKEID